MNKVRINQGRVLESGYRYMISLLLVCGMIGLFIALNNIAGFILMLVLSFLLIMLWTSFYVLEIDMGNQKYFDSTSVLGRKFGKHVAFDGIEKVFIKRVSFSQRLSGYGPNSYEKKSYEYDAYLKFTNGDKIFLVSDEDEKNLIGRLQPVLKKLGTEIVTS